MAAPDNSFGDRKEAEPDDGQWKVLTVPSSSCIHIKDMRWFFSSSIRMAVPVKSLKEKPKPKKEPKK